jgi:maleylacetoacetate isomerase
MKLYQGRTSSASWRVRWGLALKRVAYDAVFVDIAAGEHETALVAVNPMRQVPTLVLADGTALAESVAILEYLEETIPAPALLPADPRQRARVRQLVQLVNAGIHPLQNTAVRKAVAGDEEGQRRWAARWIERGLAAYERHVAGSTSRFSAGDTLTMAELYLVPQVRNARRYAVDLAPYPRVRAIADAALATAEAQATSPDAIGAPAV